MTTSARPDAPLSQAIPKLVPRKKSAQPPQSDPPPPTPTFPPPSSTNESQFIKPNRRILSPNDHEIFLSSPTYTLLTGFIFTLSDCVKDTPISAVKASELTSTVKSILQILEDVHGLLAEYPAEDTGSRFGNPVFRDFLDGVAARQSEWQSNISVPPAAIEEVSTYLDNAFGNRTRIDYGSGHELNFLLYLLTLNRLSLLPPSTFPSLVLVVFPRYLRLMRDIQMTYYLEPAGSHGVWGLDDYQFLPFLFGAAQLMHHPYIRPKSIHQELVIEEYGKEFLYLDQVGFVNSVKNVEGLRWHSPMLDDISSARNWEKVEGGMRKMFVKEVLGKLPVMQHFLFGSLIPAEESMSREDEGRGASTGEMGAEGDEEVVVMKDGMKHVHTPSSWGDCCGIKVPSSVGAVQEMRKRMGGDGLRRVPFD
ncbi:serine/threonine-protein phosphatase 2A activator 2 [Aulographum hederae CBS 113979]|uniref:Serine/threonine-protein phosphatase 2A activator n=1 Tax=Aulographum hederae CBS 113979 TaxID=1176131 RepID=A0A6G1H177_9PEZI|nr:serine/threonine-protein phosphatase 2A activator 2 [Aulographum hederae CBS 113979]